MHKDNIYFIISMLLVGAVIAAGIGYYFLFTTNGSGLIAQRVLCRYIGTDDVVIEKIDGSLAEELVLHNIVIKKMRNLPPDAVIKIQRLNVMFTAPALRGMILDIYNGRLQLAYSDTVLFYGSYRQRSVDLNLYCKRVSAREMLDLFTQRSLLSSVSGMVSDVTLHAQGTLQYVALEGTFFIDRLTNNSFTANNCPGSLLLYVSNIKTEPQVNGEILFKKGKISGRRTAVIELNTSRLVFDDDLKHPKLNLRGETKVGDVSISIILQGAIGAPKLLLMSSPPLSQELLLIMIATGKTWGGMTSAEQGRISADLIKDFVDYFFFAGNGLKIAQKYGINDVSFSYDNQTREVGVTTSLTNKVEVRYKFEPVQEQTGQSAKHVLGGGYKFTDTISIEAEKDVTPQNTAATSTAEQPQPDEKVMLQFKKQF
ncbi:MAG: translocation/assembly module TamB domain-containing protein [Candidatus Omnitrophica bacterium]|nr:translocation/assembly module TamB domain-containing protein [Candidatus Omnitrophota bacterium]